METIVDLAGLVGKLGQTVQDRKAAGELREIPRMISSLQAENSSLRQQCFDLQTQNAELKEHLASLQSPMADSNWSLDEFREHWGALFKKKSDGGYHRAAYCPRCKYPMTAQVGPANFWCMRCHVGAQFTGDEFDMVFRDLRS